MIRGAIDAFGEEGAKLFISGWAYASVEGKKLKLDTIYSTGSKDIEVSFFTRPDISNDVDLGVRVTFQSENEFFAALLGISKVVGRYGQATGDLEVWDQISSKIYSFLISRKLEGPERERQALRLVNSAAHLNRAQGLLASEFSPISAEVGFRSYDDSAVIGRSGHLFLEEGSNRLNSLYAKNADESAVEKWCTLITARHDRLADDGVEFLQMIVPEKQSVLTILYPNPINAPTPLFQAIRERLHEQNYFLDVFSIFKPLYEVDGCEPFRRVDTHLSFHGAWSIACALATRVKKYPISLEKPSLQLQVVTGDLGNKFGFGHIVETLLHPVESEWRTAQQEVDLIESFDPDEGHTGTMRRWVSKDAMLDQKVVIFGNSMFERGGGPLTLSWWAARLFREATFVWNSSIDYDLVAKTKPDLVIAQTIERFLPGVPAT